MADVEDLAQHRKTNPRGWDDHQFLHATWQGVQNLEAAVARNGRDVAAVKRLVLELDKRIVEALKRVGIRMRNVEARASQSQIDAHEAKQTAEEVESTALRTFVQDAKPFARWKSHLVAGAIGVGFTVVAAAICHACGFTPLG